MVQNIVNTCYQIAAITENHSVDSLRASFLNHFDRYIKTNDWNTAINRRQFAIDVEHFKWPTEYRYPDITYKDNISFKCTMFLNIWPLSFCIHLKNFLYIGICVQQYLE